ncbi:MAG: Unknown protein [uncultured Sulfurovum sp.]|uniref:Novel STAND NTPase 1 domain-containing protein n=1 Tax=uncultured Sulfurovum sp. TaxID=269237 RepID=A0A6S6SRG5_9BACT|nr:MAG: Unknown protein [uncultured Sulfurovum sp.]
MKKTIKIFISSPGDVIPERQKAMQIIKRLNRHFTDVKLEGVFWEREPMTATKDYQANIVYPSSTDIVAVILWTRLGSELSSSKYVGAYTNKQPITGTEWEFEDAYAKAKKEKTPHLALYRKRNDKIVIDPEQVEEMSRQQKLIQSFDNYWAKNDDGSYAMAEHTFERTDEFESMFEEHLKKIIAKIVNETLTFKANWLEGSPFRGLQSFEAQHASIFFGRNREVNESREKLQQQINKGKSFLLITGASGSGKSSLVKAGLLPDLQIAGMVKDVALSRVATFIPSDDVPIKALMSAILKALPELRELQLNEENLEKHLDDLLPIEQAMNQIAKKENLSETAKVKLVLYIDQFEELFTSANIDEAMQEAFINLLFKLFSSEHVWVVASMRSDFMSYLDNFPQLIALLNDGAEYKLHFPKETELGQIINKPAQEAGLSFGVDDNGKGLDDFLRESASRHQASLPLLEYLLEQLWEKRDQEKNQLTFEAYEALGKLEGAIGKKAGQVYEKLGSQAQKAMPELIIMLASVSDSSKNITAKRVSKRQIDKDPAIKACATALMAKDVRLLVSAKDKEGLEYYRVAHESLFSHWELAKETILVHKKDIYLRDQLEKRSQAWKESQAKDKKSLFLNDGLPLNEALELLSRRERSLAIGVVEFVRASEEHVKKRKKRNRFAIGTILVVSILVSFFMYSVKMEAENLNEKLGIIVSRLFSIGANSSGEKKVDEIMIYQTIIDEFKNSKEKEIIKLVASSYYNMGIAYYNRLLAKLASKPSYSYQS